MMNEIMSDHQIWVSLKRRSGVSAMADPGPGSCGIKVLSSSIKSSLSRGQHQAVDTARQGTSWM